MKEFNELLEALNTARKGNGTYLVEHNMDEHLKKVLLTVDDTDEAPTPNKVPRSEFTIFNSIFQRIPGIEKIYTIQRQYTNDLVNNIEDKMNHETKKIWNKVEAMDETLKPKVNAEQVQKILEKSHTISNLVSITFDHTQTLKEMTRDYVTKEEIKIQLEPKVDRGEMEVKADRKYVAKLFDFLNEKMLKVFGDEKLDEPKNIFKAFKKLEKELFQKVDRGELNLRLMGIGQKLNSSPRISENSYNNQAEEENEQKGYLPYINPKNSSQNSPTFAYVQQIQTPGYDEHAMRYRCLSCNKPVENIEKEGNTLKKFGELPPSSLPKLRNSHAMKGNDSTKRLESYHQWINGNHDIAGNLIQKSELATQDDKQYMAGGFKLSQSKEEKSSETMENPRSKLILNLKRLRKSPEPPKSAPVNLSRKKEVIPKKNSLADIDEGNLKEEPSSNSIQGYRLIDYKDLSK